MRINLTFNTNGNMVIPIQYNYHVQSMIYQNISPALADFLHDHGYVWGKRRFKLFTFSRLEGQYIMKKGSPNIEFSQQVNLTISSPVERFLQELSEGMLRNEKLHLFGQKLTLETISVYPPVEEDDFTEEIKIKMLSPVTAYNTVKKDTGSRTVYFSPWDEWFSELIRMNLEKKYELIYGEKPAGTDMKVLPIGPRDERKCKVMQYKGTVVKGWMGIYKLKGDKRLMKVAYETGLGAKNSQGFGCFEVLEGIK